MVHKILVKTVLPNGKERIVELERGALSLEKLKSELQRKTGQKGQWYIRAGNKAIHNDADLLAVVIEAEKAKEKFLIVDIVGGQAPAPTRPGVTTASRPSATPVNQTTAARPSSPATPAQSLPAPRTPAPGTAPAQEAGVFTVFTIRGTPTGADKPKVNAIPEGRSYVFRVQPAKTDVTIEVIVSSPKTLQFKLQTGSSVLAQSFNMPFDMSVSDLSIRGEDVVLTIP